MNVFNIGSITSVGLYQVSPTSSASSILIYECDRGDDNTGSAATLGYVAHGVVHHGHASIILSGWHDWLPSCVVTCREKVPGQHMCMAVNHSPPGSANNASPS